MNHAERLRMVIDRLGIDYDGDDMTAEAIDAYERARQDLWHALTSDEHRAKKGLLPKGGAL